MIEEQLVKLENKIETDIFGISKSNNKIKREKINMKNFDIEDIKKDIWIWGTGSVANQAMDAFLCTANIKGIIDNDVEKEGKLYFGHKIVTPDVADRYLLKNDIIIICREEKYTKEIERYIKKRGWRNEYCILDKNGIAKLYCYSISKYFIGNHMERGYEERLISRCCTEADFEREDLKWAAAQLKEDIENRRHRKTWEFLYIVSVLKQYDMLKGGKKGIGFAVGMEPLPSYFASQSIDVLATDLDPNAEGANGWIESNQNSGGNLKKLYYEKLCKRKDYDRNVTFRYVDMNHIPDDLKDFDFCWSSCAVEHVGSLAKAKECIKNMLKVLKVGGIAVHTTEFNLSSNSETIDTGNSVIFRRKDIEELAEWCRDNGHYMEVSFKRGNWAGDRYIDIPPYDIWTKYHLNLMINKYASTSYGIVIVKGV